MTIEKSISPIVLETPKIMRLGSLTKSLMRYLTTRWIESESLRLSQRMKSLKRSLRKNPRRKRSRNFSNNSLNRNSLRSIRNQSKFRRATIKSRKCPKIDIARSSQNPKWNKCGRIRGD